MMSRFNSKQTAHSQQTLRSIQAEFVHHCAVVIQSRMRGYFQRKKYKAFLPIYRRVKELLSALVYGWRVRRIMKLQPVRTQIGQIRLKTKNGQVSAARIAKREFVDEIERLGRKGRWIEVLVKYRMVKSKGAQEEKENSSLYGNIKSKSIKNVFKEQPTVEKEKKAKKQAAVVSIQPKWAYETREQQNKQYIIADNYDDRPIKGMHTMSLCPTEPEITPATGRNQKVQQPYLKKQQNKAKKTIVPKAGRAKPDKVRHKQQLTQQAMPQKKVEYVPQAQMMRASQVSKSSQASRKMQVTLISSIKTTGSANAINESALQMKTLQGSRSSLSFPKQQNPHRPSEVSQVYHEKYMPQKEKLISKLSSLSFAYTPSIGKAMQLFLLKY